MEQIQNVTIKPVGFVRSPRTGRSDDFWGSVESIVELDATRFSGESVAGLDAFSHLEIIFVLHEIAEGEVETTARHPRNNPHWPRVGIFAQRGARRPNRIAVSRCELLEVDGLRLKVRGLDAIDGTPVVDIKPYMREFAPLGETSQPQWATEIMTDYYAL